MDSNMANNNGSADDADKSMPPSENHRQQVVSDIENPSSSHQQQQQPPKSPIVSSPGRKSSAVSSPTVGENASTTTTLSPRHQNNSGNECYPKEFYCPITKQLLKDPVVLADGISYERSAAMVLLRNNNNLDNSNSNNDLAADTTATSDVEATVSSSSSPRNNNNNNIIMYSNRSLKTILEETTKTTSIFQKVQQFLAGSDITPLSDAFYCPITLGIMHNPVIDPQGYSYEQVAIENWIRVNGDSPVTREALTAHQLVRNVAIEQLLQAEANKKDEDQIHPAIRKWKQEVPPVPLDYNTITEETANGTTAIAGNGEGTATTIDGANTPTANNNNNNNTTNSTNPRMATFPLTPAEFQIQQEQEARNKRMRMYFRVSMLLFAIAVLICGFYFPIVAAVALVLVVLGVCLVTQDAARLDDGW